MRLLEFNEMFDLNQNLGQRHLLKYYCKNSQKIKKHKIFSFDAMSTKNN